jgi:murein DD-endopeptidase MepM/ murein hydrolase activator NlpD
MKHARNYIKRFKLCYMEAAAVTLLICLFLFPTWNPIEHNGDNYFVVKVNGTEVGVTGSKDMIDDMLVEARRNVVSQLGTDELVFMDVSLETEGSEKLFGVVDSRKDIVENMAKVLENATLESRSKSYTVKVNETSVNLSSYDEVCRLLEEAIAPYDEEGQFEVSFELDDSRELNVLQAVISKKQAAETDTNDIKMSAGIEAKLDEMFGAVEPAKTDFSDYDEGVVSIEFEQKIEVVEAYLLDEELMDLETAVNLVTKEQETQKIYKVVSGDTLSQICLANDIPMEELIAINDALESENTTIRVDQELIINVPEPELSIISKKQQVYTEDYEAEVEYVPNDEWYTTKTVTLQEPSAGRHKVAAVVEYKNGQEQSVEILKEEVYAEAVPKIVERGTQVPPTYIKPISGGTLSSGFGARSAPTKGASTYHKGIDWATPTGTTVYASNAGTVSFAGWASGYGYAVFIEHADGRQTRYGHLSKVLVSAGQTVSQGQKIALSGNTGVSTGPHVHFEIRINGTAVNPLKYLN